MHLRLEKCSIASINDLAQISRETFVAAFEKQNNPEDFKAYVDMAFATEKLRTELAHKDSLFYFAYAGDALAGYFKLNRNGAQTDLKRPESIELERIYVLEGFQGQKIGRWMLNEIKTLAFEMKKEFLWLGVWENNLRAITFYENNGFSKFGRHPYFIGKDKQMDWLMRFDLINFKRN